jgi:hypothetical protein
MSFLSEILSQNTNFSINLIEPRRKKKIVKLIEQKKKELYGASPG